MAKGIPSILYIGLNCDSTVAQLRCRIHFPPLHWAVLVTWMNNTFIYLFTYRLCGRRRGWDVQREQHWNKYTIKGETDHQPSLDAWDGCSGLVHWTIHLNQSDVLGFLEYSAESSYKWALAFLKGRDSSLWTKSCILCLGFWLTCDLFFLIAWLMDFIFV